MCKLCNTCINYIRVRVQKQRRPTNYLTDNMINNK